MSKKENIQKDDATKIDKQEKVDEEYKCQEHDDETNQLLLNRIKELEDTVLRTQAEMQNYRKRKHEETARILKYCNSDILEKFLPILDNFERALNSTNEQNNNFIEGIKLIYNQTIKLLTENEVKEIDCLGKEFNPTYEQAISTEKDETKPSGVVLKVYQKGYTYKDKVLRTAMVIVNE